MFQLANKVFDRAHPILFGSGFAVGLAGLNGAQYFRRAWSQRPYRGMCSLDVRSMKRGCNHDGD